MQSKISYVLVLLMLSFGICACSNTDATANTSNTEQIEKERRKADYEQYKKAVALAETNEPQKILEAEKILLEVSKSSSPIQILGAWHLGYVYSNKHYPPRPNYEKAIYWLTFVAEKGESIAQNDLGLMYIGLEPNQPKDLEKAEYWLRKAAEQGSVSAIGNMGTVFLHKPSPDKREAGVWFCRAADNGSIGGQYNCAVTLKSEWNNFQDYERAYRYGLLAEQQIKAINDPIKKAELMKDYGDDLKSLLNELRLKLTPTQVREIENSMATF